MTGRDWPKSSRGGPRTSDHSRNNQKIREQFRLYSVSESFTLAPVGRGDSARGEGILRSRRVKGTDSKAANSSGGLTSLRTPGVRINLSHAVEPFETIAAQLDKNGYCPVPLVFGQKRPIPERWQRYKFVPGEERRYAGAGTGLLCGSLIGLDIDVYDAAVAREIGKLARRNLGAAPSRVGEAPKVAMIYRLAGNPFAKLRTAS